MEIDFDDRQRRSLRRAAEGLRYLMKMTELRRSHPAVDSGIAAQGADFLEWLADDTPLTPDADEVSLNAALLLLVVEMVDHAHPRLDSRCRSDLAELLARFVGPRGPAPRSRLSPLEIGRAHV